MENKKNSNHQIQEKNKKPEHTCCQFMTQEKAYRQAIKCPCPYQWKSNTLKIPFM